ncbi:hypothetical protein QBC44DRAFT_108075 [Cladorrhinum sp. PSN332]|nr:hypothetical protein QBC44DRAFT_108075 [Cladorrhinum sp. PSN332]
MASRPSSVYARRPPDDDRDDRRDDRRARDRSRDRQYRRESYRRGDDYADRERNRRDDSPPSRWHPTESPRDPSFRSEASRPDDVVRAQVSTTSHLAQDSEIKKPVAPISAEKAKATDVSKALKRWGDMIKEQAKLKLHQEIMERNMKQREKDHDKSTHQNAAHPSVAELQNKYRKAMDRELKVLEDALRKGDAKEAEAMSAFVKYFTGRIPMVTLDSADPSKAFETKLTSFETMLQKQEEAHMKALKDQEEKEAQLRQEIQEIQSQRDSEKLEFQNQIQNLQENFNQMLAFQKEVDKKLGGIHTQNAEEVAKQHKQHSDLSNRVGKFIEAVEEQTKQSQSAHEDLRKELKGDFAKDLKNGLSAQSERLSGFEKQLRDLESSSFKNPVPAAKEMFVLKLDHATRLDHHQKLIEGLQAQQASHLIKTDNFYQRLQVAENKLAQIDIEALDSATEMASFGFPDLKRKVDNLENLQPGKVEKVEPRIQALEKSFGSIQESLAMIQESVKNIHITLEDDNTRLNDAESNIEMIHNQGMESIRTTFETRLGSLRTALETHVNTSLNGLTETFGKIINDLRDANNQLGTRVHTLEERAATEKSHTPAQIGLKRTASAARLTSPDSTTPGARIDSALWRHATERLNKDLATLVEKVDKLVGAIQHHDEKFAQLEAPNTTQVLEELQSKFDMIKISVESLDHRFNNLTTKHLAEHMIGILQQLCPNEAQLKADIDILKKLIKTLEGRVQEFTGKVEKVDDNIAQMILDFKENRNLSEDGLNRGSTKKRKLDSTPNGNGVARSVSDGLQ